MLRLTDGQMAALRDKVLDLANIAAGSLVFGQALADGPFSIALAPLGLTSWLVLAANAMLLMGGFKR